MSKTKESIAKLRDLPKTELLAALDRNRDELFRLKLGTYTNQVTSSALVRAKRREIARIHTVLHGRQLGLEQQGQQGQK